MNYIPLFLNCLLEIRATIDDALWYWGRKQHKPIMSHILLALSRASRPCQKERRLRVRDWSHICDFTSNWGQYTMVSGVKFYSIFHIGLNENEGTW